jgi:hypothetical protein
MSHMPPRALWRFAVDIAAGRLPALPDSPPVRICGSRNDYDAWRRGYTYASRVLRGGRWEWVSPQASLGRFSIIDRYDVQYGRCTSVRWSPSTRWTAVVSLMSGTLWLPTRSRGYTTTTC